MGLFSFFRKNKQESASGQGQFFSRSTGESPSARNGGRGAGNTRKATKAVKDDSADPVLPEKKRARRRLIGAVALVLAVVIVLPMILDSEPHPLGEDIAIQIPSRAGGDASADQAKATSAAPKEDRVAPAPVAAGGDKQAIAPGASAMPAGPAVVPLLSPSDATPAVADKPAEKPAEKPVDRIEPRPGPKAEPKPEVKDNSAAVKPTQRKEDPRKEVKEAARPKAVVKTDDAARALAILEGKTTGSDKKHAAAGGKFTIQVAALATQEKVDELRGKLSSAGIKSYTQKVATQSGERTRIRVGPFVSRDEADKMRARINKLGLNATVVPA